MRRVLVALEAHVDRRDHRPALAVVGLETTGDFAVTTVVLAACVVASLVVRETFGYSFSTWRLHLRGETIRSAIDVGWMRQLTVGRMMRREPATIPATRHPGRIAPPLSRWARPSGWSWSTPTAATWAWP